MSATCTHSTGTIVRGDNTRFLLNQSFAPPLLPTILLIYRQSLPAFGGNVIDSGSRSLLLLYSGNNRISVGMKDKYILLCTVRLWDHVSSACGVSTLDD